MKPGDSPGAARPPRRKKLSKAELARAQERGYVSQGKAVSKVAYTSKPVAARRAEVKRAATASPAQRARKPDIATVQRVHGERHRADVAEKREHGELKRVTARREQQARAQEAAYVSQAQAVEKAGTAADRAARKVDDGSLKVGGVSVKPSSIAKAVLSRVPGVRAGYQAVKTLDTSAEALDAPASSALKNIDRPANALRGEIKRTIEKDGLKEFLVGTPRMAKPKELKEIRQTAKRHVQLKETTTGSDVLKEAGVKNKAVRAIGGFGVDVASSAATLPVGGVGTAAARAGQKAAAKAAVKGSRHSRPVRKAAKGARAGAAARGATPRAQRAAGRQAVQVARGRATVLADRNRAAAVAAVEAGETPTRVARVAAKAGRGGKVSSKLAARTRKARGGQGIGMRYAGMEIPGTRAATAAVGRGTRKVTRSKPAMTEVERRAGDKLKQAERSARGGKEQAMSRAQRVARRAHKDLSPAEYERVAHALDTGNVKSLKDERLIRAAVDLRSAFRHEHKAERRAGVSASRRPDDFLTEADARKLKETIKKQQAGAKKQVQVARASGDAGRLATKKQRRAAVESLPQQGRGAGVPHAETHAAWLQRVRAHADTSDLKLVRRRADKLLAKTPKAEDVARGYFPREVGERAERNAGVAEKTAGAPAPRGGTARVATAATGGHARADVRRLDIVQAERAAAKQEPFSTNVPLVAGSRVRDAGRAVAESDFARNVASQGRRVSSADDLREGEKLYTLGRKGGKYGLHSAKDTGRNVQREWRDYDRAVAAGQHPAKPKALRTTTPKGKAVQPKQHYAIPESTVQAMDEANRLMPAVEAKLLDKMTAGWKTLATYNPAFHMRNAAGDIQRLAEMPGNPLSTLSKLSSGTQAARAVRQSERYRQKPGITDPLNKGTIKVAGKEMPVRQFVGMLREHKLVDVGRTQQERAEAAMLRGQGEGMGNILRGRGKGRMQGGPFGGRYGRALSTDPANAIRATAFKAGLDMGMSPAKAADQAHKFFVDYGRMTPQERQLFRRIFPFYTWTARSLPVTLAGYATRPARYANLNSARNEWNQAVTGMSPDELEAQMKPFTRNNLPVVIPIGGGKFAAVSASWPAALVQYAPLGIGPKAAGGTLNQIYKLHTGQLNFFAKVLVEASSAGATGAGLNLGTQKLIENPKSPRVKAPSWAADLPSWAKKELLVDHEKDETTGKTNVVWRGWASWALRQGSVGLAGQAARGADANRTGRVNTFPAKMAEFLGVAVEDLGPDITKANERIKKYERVAELNKQLQQLPVGVGEDKPTPKWRKLRDELNGIERELRPKKPGALDIGLGAGAAGTGPDIGLGAK